uniref:Uncharacterized protein n=1 Tax=Pyramimonas obovata TaxID=1411642 RepID=A0A7S0RQL2_9CHLO|mmetsp:Transcript_4028/g.8288  ORF Transcript_4028/g.8288 Transcript_4028/m.8288 type:complete len:308 (+) Transcript_4028:256-1179(+)
MAMVSQPKSVTTLQLQTAGSVPSRSTHRVQRTRAVCSKSRMIVCCARRSLPKGVESRRSTLPQVCADKRSRPARDVHVCMSMAGSPSMGPEDSPQDGLPGGNTLQTETGLQAMDFSLVIYGCTALYLPTVIYGLGAFFLSTSTTLPTLGFYLPKLLVKTIATNFQQIIGVHHLLLNVAICLSLIPALRERSSRFFRDHLLESSYMATLGLDLFPIFLQFARDNALMQVVCVALSAAIAALGLYSAFNVLRISLQDRRDSFEARATTVIWGIILVILGVCSREPRYFFFLALLIWLRWERFKFSGINK